MRVDIKDVLVSLLLLAAMLGAVDSEARGRGAGGNATVTGSIYTINAAGKSITIKTSAGTNTKLAVGRNAAITRNGTQAKLSDLALNDSVTAQFRSARLVANALTATGPGVTKVSGKPSNVSLAGGALSVGSQTVQTNASTRISRNGQIVALRQLTSNDTLVAHLALGTNVALDLVGDGPDESEVQGLISAVVGSNVTITPDDGSPAVTIVVDSSTIIEVNDAPGTLADLQAGLAVDAEYDPTTFAAFSIDVSSESEDAEIQGTVFAVDTTAGTVTITPQGGGPNVVLTVNASTEIDVNDEGGTLADIQVGMPIQAEYDATTLLASDIEAGTSGED